jgi:hypothetical protein
LWAQLGFVCRVGWENRSNRQADWRSYYTDTDAALIANVCGADVAAFGYAFDQHV